MVYKQTPTGAYDMSVHPEIAYHAPVMPGTKRRKFESLPEMSSYRK